MLDFLNNILGMAALVITGFVGASGGQITQTVPVDSPSYTIELDIAELSPNGEAGGYAMPASGGSAGSGCTISLTPNTFTPGDTIAYSLTLPSVGFNGSVSINLSVCDVANTTPINCTLISSLSGSLGATLNGSIDTTLFTPVQHLIQAVYNGSYKPGLGDIDDVAISGSCGEFLTTPQPNLTSLNLVVPAMAIDTPASISADVANNGTVNIVSSFDDIFEYRSSSTGPWIQIGTLSNQSAMATGTTVTESRIFTPTATGTVYIQHCVDQGNNISELNETVADNCTTGSFEVGTSTPPSPNLISVVGSLTLDSGTLEESESVTFSAQVDNIGNADSGVFDDNFTYCWGAGCTDFVNNLIGGLIPHVNMASTSTARTDTSVSLNLTQPGTLRVQHCVDADSPEEVTESDETDNCTTADFTVIADTSPPPTATLEVKNFTEGTLFSENNLTINEGDVIYLKWSSTDATSCSFNNFNGNGGSLTGGVDTTITGPTAGALITYTVLCSGASDSLKVTANSASPPPTITATPRIIRADGDPTPDDTNISWDTGKFINTECSLTGPSGIESQNPVSIDSGSVGDDGSLFINLENTAVFTIDCGTEEDSVTVQVLPQIFPT